MTTAGPPNVHERAQASLVAGLRELLARHGDPAAAASAPVAAAVDQMRVALEASAEDGSSLSSLEVVRIRLGKFAASRLPAEVFRDPTRLAALRTDIRELARRWLNEEAGAP